MALLIVLGPPLTVVRMTDAEVPVPSIEDTRYHACRDAIWRAIAQGVATGVPERDIRSVLLGAAYANEKAWLHTINDVATREAPDA